MNRRVVNVLCMLVLCTLAFAGVAAAKVTIWETRAPGNRFGPYEEEYARLAEMIKEELGIEIEVVFYGDAIRDKLVATLGTDLHPDLITYPQWDLVFQGMFEDLTPYIARSDFDTDRYPQPALQHWQVDGKLYVLPQSFTHQVLYYNKDLFNQLGLAEPPTRWDDPSWTVDHFREIARKGTQMEGNGAYRTMGIGRLPGDLFTRSFWWGASWLDENGNLTTDHPGILDALHWSRELVELGVYQPVSSPSAQSWTSWKDFSRGDVLMSVQNDFALGLMQTEVEGGFDWNVAPLPRAVQPATSGYAWGYTILSGSDNKDEAWEVLKWLETEPSAANLSIRFSFYPPARPDLADRYMDLRGPVLPQDLNLQVILDGHQYARLTRLAKDPSWNEVASWVGRSVRDVETGVMSPVEWAEQAKTRIAAMREH